MMGFRSLIMGFRFRGPIMGARGPRVPYYGV